MSLDVGGGGGDARGALGTIKDWVKARIAEALRTHIGRTWLFVNGVGVAARHKIDVQMAGATGEDHPELDLVRAILPEAGGGGGSGGVWTQIEQHTVPSGGEGEFTFASIPQTYDHLVLVGDNILLVSTESFAAAGGKIVVQPNAWDGSDYNVKNHRYGAVTHGVDTVAPQGIVAGYADALEWGGSDQAGFTLWIPGYTVNVLTRNFYGFGDKGFTNHVGWQANGTWRRPPDPPDDTTTITSLRIVADLLGSNAPGNSFAEGSRLTLYGIKDSPTGTVGGGGSLVCQVSDSGAVAISLSGAFPFDTDDIDPDGFHDTTTNTTRLTVPADMAGWYRFFGYVRLSYQDVTGPNKDWYVEVRQNGPGGHIYSQTGQFGTLYDTDVLFTSPWFQLAVGDYVELVIQHNSGATIFADGDTHFGLEKLP